MNFRCVELEREAALARAVRHATPLDNARILESRGLSRAGVQRDAAAVAHVYRPIRSHGLPCPKHTYSGVEWKQAQFRTRVRVTKERTKTRHVRAPRRR